MPRKLKTKKERGANWEPKVIHQKDRGRWMVDCGFKFDPDKRLRLFFPTEQDARECADNKRAEFLELLAGRKAEAKQGTFARISSLTDTQRNHIVEALSISGGDTSKIIRALRFYDKHTSTADASRKLSDVSKEYIAAKNQAGRRPRTVRDAEGKLDPFVEVFGERSISEISISDVEGWLNAQEYTPGTRNAYRVAIVGLFNHAVKRRYTEHNPAAAIEAATVDQGLPEIHAVKQVKKMLNTAAAKLDTHAKRAKVIPYLAIGYFAGLRPENELINLDWKDIDFEARTIRVDPATAKKRRQRFVDMSDNLIKWLAPYVQKSGKIGYSRRLFRDVRKKAGIEWPKDVMRHSFGSYLLASNEDAPKTAMQMGHSRVDVLFNHYRNLVKKSAALEYWNIVPEDQAKIMQMPIAKAG